MQVAASYFEKYNSSSNRECNRPLERITDLTGESQSTSSVAVFITPDNRYRVGYQVPYVSVEGSHSTSWKLEGDCRNPFMARSGGSKSLMSRGVTPNRVEIDGMLDPKNPHVITGSKTETVERNGGTMTITVTWNIARCNTGSSR